MASNVTFSFGRLDALIEVTDDMPEAVMEALYNRVYALSPVLTGAYRAGWNYELDSNIGLLTNDDLPIEKLIALENGHSAATAPNGILRPAVAELKYTILDIIKSQKI